MTKDMKDFKFIVWEDHGYEGWAWHGYDTIEEAVNHNSYGAVKIITKPVIVVIKVGGAE